MKRMKIYATAVFSFCWAILFLVVGIFMLAFNAPIIIWPIIWFISVLITANWINNKNERELKKLIKSIGQGFAGGVNSGA